ncbi:MAG: EthD domain-containing protein [Halioglobus sp.]|nr:EthD domain-containing protein [Halioglobus sp.]
MMTQPSQLMKPDLVMVHGLFASGAASALDDVGRARGGAVAEYGEALGVCHYEWVSGHERKLANRFLRRARGTARPVDAVEIMELNETIVRASLKDQSARIQWRKMLGCELYGLDVDRSFILVGKPRQLLEGPAKGQRLLWFGRGLSQLSEAEFVAHYTGHHGPLVASYARPLGLRKYRQVPNEEAAICNALRELGLGGGIPTPVFAELVMGAPPLALASLRTRKTASREIEADEKRHIDFPHSMLLLVKGS